MSPLNVLISGAGIAGMTLAYWLARTGAHITVVERAAGQRSSGSPVDVRGRAADIAERMGILQRLREAATDVAGMRLIDTHGHVAARLDAISSDRRAPEVEIARGDLASILQAACADRAEVLFDDAIRALAQDPDGVDVAFETASPRRFDLVIGADGLHSGVRRLVFGAERQFVRHAGLYVATLPLDNGADDLGRYITMFNAPGRSATIHPARTRPLAAFIFWHPALPDLDYRDIEQHRRFVTQTYQMDGWRVPALLASMQHARDLYFDSVSRVQLRHWSVGRVVLLGDAASCVSLLGDGSSMAMIGANVLAESLAEFHGDHRRAFRAYEQRHRRSIETRQRWMPLTARLLVPKTSTGIALRNAALRLAPLTTALATGRRARARPPASHILSPGCVLEGDRHTVSDKGERHESHSYPRATGL